MGKPSSSCLKIIACGSDSAVEDDVEAPEAKSSGGKRGWSFRKRSARHRVLSNSVTSENLTLGDKEIPRSTTIQSQTPVDPTIPEKVVVLEQSDEKDQLPASVELKPPKSIKAEQAETFDVPKPPISVEPEVFEAPDAPKPPISVEPEVFEAPDAPKPPGLIEPEVSETSDAPKPPGSVEPDVCETVDASESAELVEPKRHVSAVPPESINLDEPEVSATVVVPASKPPAPVESKILDGLVAPESPVSTEMELSETAVASQDDILEETIVLDIQTGIRGFLAQRELEKVRSAVKLQAAMRGHLIRRHAVDTLYCMQGIVKVQSLVRAGHSKLLGDKVTVTKPIMKSSTEKLLRNGFTRQLLVSTPKSKSTVTKCDPLKPNSAWAWLERWMAISSSGLADLDAQEIRTEDGQSQVEKTSIEMECEILSEVKSESINPEFAVQEASKAFENEKSSISYDPAEECQPSNLLSCESKMEQPYDNNGASFEEPLGMAATENESIQSDSLSQAQSGSLSSNLGVETEEPKFYTKRMAFEQVDVESKKFAYGSRKASNPALIASQSKFEELSSAANSSVSLKSPHQNASSGYHPDTASSLEENLFKGKEPSGKKALVPDETLANMVGSECGAVTFTSDSRDQSEAEVAEMDLEVKYMEERASNHVSNESLEVKANGSSSVYVSNSSSVALSQKEFHESNGVSKPVVVEESHQPEQKPEAIASDEQDNAGYVDLNMAAHSPQAEQKPERSASDVQVEACSATEQPASELSPGTSPNESHMTIPESQGTPASLVSVKAKRSKVNKSGSNTKRSSLSAGKKTAAKPVHDSGSGEQLSKDQNSEKRRSSFGSTKSDNVDQEPRDSSNSAKTLPGYMQATESARAKAHSPRSSPDVQNKDTYIIKKRHSLPGAGGKQGSPRVQQSKSQSPQPQQPEKGNVNTPPQERRWLR